MTLGAKPSLRELTVSFGKSANGDLYNDERPEKLEYLG